MITDGLPELRNRNDEIFDYPQVKNYFNKIADASPEEIIKDLVKKADAWMSGTPLADDITFIVMKVL